MQGIEYLKNFLSETWASISEPPFLPLFVLGFGLLLAGIILRLILGSNRMRDAGKTASICLTLVLIYIIALFVLGEDGHLQIFAAALPFIDKMADSISILTMMKTDFPSFMIEVTKVFFLTLTLSVIKMFFERRKKGEINIVKGFLQFLFRFVLWYILECITVALGLFINAMIVKILEKIGGAAFAKWLPVVLFGILGIAIILAILKMFFSTVGLFAKPFFDLLYRAFIENRFGRTVRNAYFATLLVTAVTLLGDHLGWFDGFLFVGLPVFAPVLILLFVLGYIVWAFWA